MWRKLGNIFIYTFLIVGNIISIISGAFIGFMIAITGELMLGAISITAGAQSEESYIAMIVIGIIYFVVHVIAGFVFTMMVTTSYKIALEMADNIAAIEHNTRPKYPEYKQ